MSSDGVLGWSLLKIHPLPWKDNNNNVHTKAHWHTNKHRQTWAAANTLFFPLSLCPTHTPTFMITNWISAVWRQSLLLWRQQVFRRGDGHRKEGGILSTRSFPFGCPSCCRTKEMDGKKRGGDSDRKQEPLQWQVLCQRSNRSFLSFIHPLPLSVPPPAPSSLLISFSSFYIPSLLTSSSHLCLSSSLCPPPFLCSSSPHWRGQPGPL